MFTASVGLLCLAASDGSSSQESFVVTRFVRLYESGRFAEAARLFHCPPSYTDAEVEADLKRVEASLRIMSDLYGPIRSVSESAASAYVASTTACGTAEYWKANPPHTTRILRTDQRESEHGYLVFQSSSVAGKPVLFQFGHGLPITHPEARSRFERFLERKLAP